MKTTPSLVVAGPCLVAGVLTTTSHITEQAATAARGLLLAAARASSSDWGRTLERLARGLAVTVAAIWTAGWVLGTSLHRSSAWLAVHWLWGAAAREPSASRHPRTQSAAPAAAAALAHQPSTPAPAAAGGACRPHAARVAAPAGATHLKAPGLTSLPEVQLRRIARAQGLKHAGRRRIAQATRTTLLEVLA